MNALRTGEAYGRIATDWCARAGGGVIRLSLDSGLLDVSSPSQSNEEIASLREAITAVVACGEAGGWVCCWQTSAVVVGFLSSLLVQQ